MKRSSKKQSRRRGMIAVLSAVLFIVMLAMVAFAVDIGYMGMVKTELQSAADASALAAAGASNQSRSGMVQVAQSFAQYHQLGARAVQLNSEDVQFGTWDVSSRTFTPVSSGDLGSAVKVTVRADTSSGGNAPLFFGHVLGAESKAMQASAVAMVNPRDIAFVVDLSGSMNFDSSPGQSSANTNFIKDVYTDFGFAYPGGTATYKASKTIEQNMANAASAMPNAIPAIDSTSEESKLYWQAFFTYLGSNGTISYNNYIKFMMNRGRDQPVVTEVKDGQGNITRAAQYSPLSTNSPHCPYHNETIDGVGTYSFPPREMPTHAVRRALIAAIGVIQERNALIADANQKDKVSIVVFDAKNTASDTSHVRVAQPLTVDYAAAINACLTLQACNSNSSCTDSEGGIICAVNHIKPSSEGGAGRINANKVIVFLTDGNANLYESSDSTINAYKNAHPSASWGSSYAENGALMQSSIAQGANSSLYAVGVGAGGNQTFMDRMAKNAGTAKNNAAYPIASDSATYEATLKSIFQGIISNPKLRLVQ
jgi:Flp pilus assembly protein TadG